MFRSKITDVFFDLDHTLWDFDRNSALTFQLLFQKHQLAVNLEQFLEFYTPINLKYWKLYREEKVEKEALRYLRLRESFDLLQFKIDDNTIGLLSEEYIDNLSSFKHVLPGTFEILEYLKEHYRLHIITNGFAEGQEKKMRNSNIRHYFEVVVNSEMAGVKKPNPKIFQLALENAQVSAEQSMMIGDNFEADILGAQKVGFSTLHLLEKGAIPEKQSPYIRELKEIKNFL